jgi:hypothetical protein
MMPSAGAICSRRDAVKLAKNEGLQPRASEQPLVGCYAELGRSLRDLSKFLLDSLRKVDPNEIVAREQVVLSGLVDHTNHTVLIRKIIV